MPLIRNRRSYVDVAGSAVITSGGQPVVTTSEDDDDGVLKPLSERLVMELTAHRTLALREAVGRSPDVALTLFLLKLVTDTFRSSSATGSCLEASVRPQGRHAHHPICTKEPVLALKLSQVTLTLIVCMGWIVLSFGVGVAKDCLKRLGKCTLCSFTKSDGDVKREIFFIWLQRLKGSCVAIYI